ncbi:MAG: response regulator [Gemmatimonadales bacterium]|nr:MAG: response regulator [Gemmatimonadales bacterium]
MTGEDEGQGASPAGGDARSAEGRADEARRVLKVGDPEVRMAFQRIVLESPDAIFMYRVEPLDGASDLDDLDMSADADAWEGVGVDSSPGAASEEGEAELWGDAAYRRVWMNRTARALVREDAHSLLGTRVHEHPNGILGADLLHVLDAVRLEGGSTERVLEVDDGVKTRAFRVRARRVGSLLALRLMEVTERVRAERQSQQRESILRGAARVGRLLLERPWREVLPQVMAELGRSTAMSRAYLFVRRPDSDDPPVFDQVEEWAAPGVRSQRDDPELQGVIFRERGLGEWEERLLAGRPVHEVIPDAEPFIRDFFGPMDIHALLCMPVTVEGKLWGILGLDDCVRAREWTEGELDVLRSAADLLAGAVHREKQALQLEESNARMAAAVSASEDAFLLATPAGEVLECNPAAIRLFLPDQDEGADLAELRVGRVVQDCLPGLLDELRPGPWTTLRMERQGRTERGDVFPCQVQVVRVQVAGGPLFAISVRDLTHRKALEDQLWQVQKLETVGRLAGGVAHDFNNLLTVIRGNADLARSVLEEGADVGYELEEVARAADRGGRLTQQLLAFSRRQVLQPVALNLNELSRDTARLFDPLIGEHIEVRLDLSDNLWLVRADPSQMEQVVMNLVLNARDAMPRGGRLTVETSNVELDEAYTETHMGAEEGEYVLLTVSDTGTGIEPQHLDRIFEPFFTTKKHGEGTGLGLSTVYGVVKQSRGDIWVYSEPGEGTTFKIYLPRWEDGGAVSREGTEAEDASPQPVGVDEGAGTGAGTGARPIPGGPGSEVQGTQRILLAEDDDAVRAVTVRVLGQLGYDVEKAASAEEALDVLRTGAEFDLLLTDVVLPEMSGRDLAHRAQELRPRLRVLFTSGYTVNAIVHQGMLDPGIHFVEKPFTPLSLGRAVRRALDAPEDPTLPDRLE